MRWTSKGQASLAHLPREIIDPELQEHLEQHLKKQFCQLHVQWPHKNQELLHLIKPQEEPPEMGQAEVNDGTACPSTLTDESSQHPQSVSPKVPKTAQLLRDPCKDLNNCLGSILNDLDRSPEGSLGKVVENISDAEVEASYLKHPGVDTPSFALVGPRKKHLEGTLHIHSSSKCKHIHNSKMAMERTSFHDLNSHKKDSQGPSFLNPGTQKVLETHLTRCPVKHPCSLALRGLKTIPVFNRNKATSVPFQMPSNASLSFGDSRDNSLPTNPSILGEAFRKPQKRLE
ncbi:spermatogenesis-associated protein 31D1-like [Mesocricetus auratus]|uniref:Spermatogenesis-associated protein 31D1-like n=1 Tax=Mesocricetus auratus TaxID=10036 RepID=A0ABM2X5S9_MESAU|nr:spermatogenesis-associated protein 31D1-like [Mesocricetus auratus]